MEARGSEKFVDILEERRNSSDVKWMFRTLDPVAPYNLPPGLKYSKAQQIKAVLANPRVVLLIKSLASDRNVPTTAVEKEARDMLDEMAGNPQLQTIRCLGILVTKGLKRILKTIRINQSFLMELKEKMRLDGVQYVYVPSHRSYLDFVLLSYILFSNDMAIPNIASGMDFYRMRVVGELLRKSGAFYMRRTFATDQLYKEVFRAYISCLVAHSERAIEFFIEGTRSRSQKSLAPKYGLLSMVLEGLWKGDVPDIKFVPLSITYDRPLEELLFAYELLGVPKPPESTRGLFKSLSILNEPHAYGNAYVNFASPISARQFVDLDTLRQSALSPHSKMPSKVVKGLASAIIDSHKRHTPLSPFNIIALLFNERVQSYPGEPYVLETLITDYCWLKEFFSDTINTVVHPVKTEPGGDLKDEDEVRSEVLESLFTHRELLTFNSNGKLTLMERHGDSQTCDPRKVKGHLLCEQTMTLAVPAINLTIYMNPSMAFLANPALVAVSVIESGVPKESVFARYTLLRELLITEFALDSGKSIAATEWEEGLSLLVDKKCIRLENNYVVLGSNNRLFSLLQNLLIPFVAASYVTCTVLHQWSDDMGEAKESHVLKSVQKQAELLLLKGQGIFRHPYSLSLDLYASTLASLVSMGVISSSGRPPNTTYASDGTQLGALIKELDNFKILSPVGSYLDVQLLPALQASVIPQSKL